MAGAFLLVGGALALLARRAAAAIAPGSSSDPAPWSTLADSVAGLLDAVAAPVVEVGDAVNNITNTITGAGWQPPGRAAPYLAAIAAAEDSNGIPRNLLARLLYQESRFREDIISGATSSPAGALGIAQFMPATAAEFGLNPLDPYASIAAAGRYLAQLYRRFGNWPEALAAYNWGQGNVSRKGLAAAPLETRNYVAQITGDIFNA